MLSLASWDPAAHSQVCRSSPAEKGRYIKIILALLQSNSTAVVYECAVTLVSLSQAPSAIRAAANCYCQLLASQSDNNVKLIVLERLQELKDKHRYMVGCRLTWLQLVHLLRHTCTHNSRKHTKLHGL